MGAHHSGHSWWHLWRWDSSGSEDCRYTEVSPKLLSLQCCDYRESVEFLIIYDLKSCLFYWRWVGRGQRDLLGRQRWGAALWDPSLGVPWLLSSNWDKWPHSKQQEVLVKWKPLSSAVGEEAFLPSGVLPDPFHILKRSRETTARFIFILIEKFASVSAFCFLLTLFVNLQRKPFFLSHSNSFKRTRLICCLI